MTIINRRKFGKLVRPLFSALVLFTIVVNIALACHGNIRGHNDCNGGNASLQIVSGEGWTVVNSHISPTSWSENKTVVVKASINWIHRDGRTEHWEDSRTFNKVEGCYKPTNTPTPVPPTATDTATETPVPPTATDTATETPVPPTATDTATETPVPPTATDTATETPVPPTATDTATETPVPPTATDTATETPVPPTATDTATETPVPPTATVMVTAPPQVPPTEEIPEEPTEEPEGHAPGRGIFEVHVCPDCLGHLPDLVVVPYEPSIGWDWETVVDIAENGNVEKLQVFGPSETHCENDCILKFVVPFDAHNKNNPDLSYGVFKVISRDVNGRPNRLEVAKDESGQDINWLRPNIVWDEEKDEWGPQQGGSTTAYVPCPPCPTESTAKAEEAPQVPAPTETPIPTVERPTPVPAPTGTGGGGGAEKPAHLPQTGGYTPGWAWAGLLLGGFVMLFAGFAFFMPAAAEVRKD